MSIAKLPADRFLPILKYPILSSRFAYRVSRHSSLVIGQQTELNANKQNTRVASLHSAKLLILTLFFIFHFFRLLLDFVQVQIE